MQKKIINLEPNQSGHNFADAKMSTNSITFTRTSVRRTDWITAFYIWMELLINLRE